MGEREQFTRPDPEALLSRVESEERRNSRGRLKIFLGYAPRVGKSAKMFDEGTRRKSRGQDVIVGGVQQKGAAELANKLAAFEVIPPLQIEGGTALDAHAILRRAPGAALVDELAYDNPPGAPCKQRWQEIEQFLKSGINVITCINLQHVFEQQDAVERITGRRASCSVPEAFVRSADEIELVDVAPEDLAANDRQALHYDARQLSQLRELALLLAAEVVENQLERYMDAHGLNQSWGTKERILVCVTPRSNVRAMIETGRRNTDRFHGQLLVAYVSQPNLNREDEELLERNLDYARKLGGEIHVLDESSDPIHSLVDFARAQRVTQMFVGHTQRKSWSFWSQSPLKKLIEAAEGMDVRIFPSRRVA